MSFLDLLGLALGPELSSSEVARVRSVLYHHDPPVADTPWPSGIIDPPEKKSEVEVLRERVADLELAVKVLCDVLTERGLLERDGFPARIADAHRQLAVEAIAKEEAERARLEAARVAAEARTVRCAACRREVRQRDTFLSANGALCPACHASSDE